MSTSFDTRRRNVAATSAATIPPKEWPITAGASSAEGVEQLVVVQDEVPQVVERLGCRPGRPAWCRGARARTR